MSQTTPVNPTPRKNGTRDAGDNQCDPLFLRWAYSWSGRGNSQAQVLISFGKPGIGTVLCQFEHRPVVERPLVGGSRSPPEGMEYPMDPEMESAVHRANGSAGKVGS
jgi:hypothetical protein